MSSEILNFSSVIDLLKSVDNYRAIHLSKELILYLVVVFVISFIVQFKCT